MKKIIILILTSLFFICRAYTQTSIADLAPKSPEASNLIKSIEVPIGKYTGTFSSSIPIGEVTEGRINVPVSLDYRGESKRAAETASPAGLGWNLSSYGIITRKVNGLRDEIPLIGFIDRRDENANLGSGDLYRDIQSDIENGSSNDMYLDYLNPSSCLDFEPDEFYFNLGGLSGKFAFSWDDEEDIKIGCSNDSIKIESYETETIITPGMASLTILKNWVITDTRGFRYTFGAYEITQTHQTGGPTIDGCRENVSFDDAMVSTWHLTKVEDLLNPTDFIMFDYEIGYYQPASLPLESVKILSPLASEQCQIDYSLNGGGNPRIYINDLDQIIRETKIYGKKLKRIYNTNNKKKIEFNYITQRNDVGSISGDTPRRLDNISLYTNGNKLYEYSLDYYDDSNQKLLLKSIQKKNGSEMEPPYQFEYHAPIVRADDPLSTDHWGFPNGSTNTTNLPEFFPATNLSQGSDRSSNFEGSRSYIMKKIIYPTGAYKEFEFEQNQACFINNSPTNQYLANNLNSAELFLFRNDLDLIHRVDTTLFCNVDNINLNVNGPNPGISHQFIKRNELRLATDDFVQVGISGKIYNSDYSHQYNIAGYHIPAFKYVDLLLEDATTFDYEGGGTLTITGEGQDIEGDDQTHYIRYNFAVKIPVNTDTYQPVTFNYGGANPLGRSSISLGYYETVIPEELDSDNEDLPPYPLAIGGVRVSKIKTYNSDGTLENVKNYKYEESAGYSSGVIYGLPRYFDPFIRLIWSLSTITAGPNGPVDNFYNSSDCEEWDISTSSHTIIGATKGSHIGYKRVIEYNSGTDTEAAEYQSNEIGYAISNYSSPYEHPDYIDYDRPYGHPHTSYFKTGLLKSDSIFNSNNKLVKALSNEYSYKQVGFASIKLSVGDITFLPPFTNSSPSGGPISPSEVEGDVLQLWYQAPFSRSVAWSYTPLRFGHANLTKSTTTTYNENGAQPITDIVEYTHDPIYNNLSSMKTWRETNGNETHESGEDYSSTEHLYVYDGVGACNDNNNANSILALLTSKNMVGIPMQTTLSTNGTLITGEKTEYEVADWSLINEDKVLFPIKEYEVVTGVMKPSKKTILWQADGKPIQVKNYKIDGTLDDNYSEIVWNNDLTEQIIEYSNLGSRTTSFTYNDLRQIEKQTDHNGMITEYDYDGLQRLWKKRTGKGTGNGIAVGTNTGFKEELEYVYTYKLDANGKIQDGVENSIETIISYPQDPLLPNQVSRVISDGLGRNIRAEKDNYDSEAQNTIIAGRTTYDDYGRVDTTFALGNGWVKNHYEASPMSRTLEVEKSIVGSLSSSFGSNTSSVTINGKTYPIGSLSKVITIDANGNESINYTDSFGKLIQNKRFVSINGAAPQAVVTTLHHNALGQLIETVPPYGSSYLYTYNSLGLLASKTVPNKGMYQYWYDVLGREVINVDPAINYFAKEYDDLGRVIKNGLLNNHTPASSEYFYQIGELTLADDEVHNQSFFHNNNDGSPIDWLDYTETKDLSNNNMLQTRFRDYDFLGRITKVEKDNTIGGVEITETTFNDANLTTYEKVTHNANNTNNFGNEVVIEWNSTFDNALRLKKTQILDPVSNQWQTLSNLVYDDKAQIIQKQLHQANNKYWQDIDYGFDEAGRLIAINDTETISSCNQSSFSLCDISISLPINASIDAINISLDKGINNNSIKLDNLKYPFILDRNNVRIFKSELEKWILENGCILDHISISEDFRDITIAQSNAPLFNINFNKSGTTPFTNLDCCDVEPLRNTDLFAQKLMYMPNEGSNIQAIHWGTACANLQAYDFNYDELDRLLSANYYKNDGQNFISTGDYSMQSTYDLLGNITSLKRWGLDNNNTKVLIDNLNYTYDNALGKLSQLASVNDIGTLQGMKQGVANYTYDANGNLDWDSQKLLGTSYNHFNLPSTISKSGSADQTQFHYLGDMKKYRMQTVINGNTVNKDFVGDFEYEDGILKHMIHADGRIKFKPNNEFIYEYTLSDHLDNNRVTFTDVNGDDVIGVEDILEENNFYPFGMRMENNGISSNTDHNQYMYNGKEHINELDLGWYHYGFRMYDPAIARFTAVDPAASKLQSKSNYSYAHNNPVNKVDYLGLNGTDPSLSEKDIEKILAQIRKAIEEREEALAKLEQYLKDTYPNRPDIIEAGIEAFDQVIENLTNLELAVESFSEVTYGPRAAKTIGLGFKKKIKIPFTKKEFGLSFFRLTLDMNLTSVRMEKEGYVGTYNLEEGLVTKRESYKATDPGMWTFSMGGRARLKSFFGLGPGFEVSGDSRFEADPGSTGAMNQVDQIQVGPLSISVQGSNITVGYSLYSLRKTIGLGIVSDSNVEIKASATANIKYKGVKGDNGNTVLIERSFIRQQVQSLRPRN